MVLPGLAPGSMRARAGWATPTTPQPVPSARAQAVTAGPGAAARESVSGLAAKPPAEVQVVVDKDTGVYYQKYTDAVTHQPLRQEPPAAVLAQAKRLREASRAGSTAKDVVISVDKDTGIYCYRSVDPVTQRTLDQNPPKEVLALAKRLRESSRIPAPGQDQAKGAVVDLQG